MSRGKKWLLGCLITPFALLVLAIAGGLIIQALSPPPAAPEPPPATKVTATELLREYDANQVAADQKYKGHIVEVTGTVESIAKDILGKPYVSLSSGQRYSFTSVQCTFNRTADESQLAQLYKGQTVVIRGECVGFLLISVVVDDSVLIAKS